MNDTHSAPSKSFVNHTDGTRCMYGTLETWPKAFRVGPLFPRKNRLAANEAVKAIRTKQKSQGRLLYDDMKKVAEEAVTGKGLKQFVKAVRKVAAKKG